MSAQARGLAFEKQIERMFKQLGYWRVRRDVTLRDRNGNISQIDVVCGLWRRYYVECKCYTGPVPLEMVAKFRAVLELNGIPLKRGIFITNSTFVPRATTIDVRTVDGTQLDVMRKQAKRKRSRRVALTGIIAVALVGVVVVTQLHD